MREIAVFGPPFGENWLSSPRRVRQRPSSGESSLDRELFPSGTDPSGGRARCLAARGLTPGRERLAQIVRSESVAFTRSNAVHAEPPATPLLEDQLSEQRAVRFTQRG